MNETRAPSRDAVWIGLAAFVFYRVFEQVTVYGDGPQFVVWVTTGQLFHAVHLAYLPLLHLVNDTLGAAGLGFYASATMFSAFGAAAGTSCAWFGARALGLDRGRCALFAGLVAATPSVAFFATVIEVHAVFFGLVGLAFAVAAPVVRTGGSVGRGVAIGTVTGLACAVHASGIVLPAALAGWVGAERLAQRAPLRPAITTFGVALLPHAALVLGAPAFVGWFGGVHVMSTSAFLAHYEWQPLSESLWPTLRFEWLWPFAPMSVVFLAGLARRATRWPTIVTAIGAVAYLLVALKVVPNVNEHGAYLIPLALLTSIVTVRAVPRAVGVVLLVIAIAVSIYEIEAHDEPDRSRSLAAGANALADGREIVMFVADAPAMEACLSALPDAQMEWLGQLLMMPADQQDDLVEALERELSRADDRDAVVLIHERADQILHAVRGTYPAASTMLEFFETRCDAEAVEHGAFRGRRVRLR